MKKWILATLAALLIPVGTASAIDAGTARKLAYQRARWIASCDQGGWKCVALIMNPLHGPYNAKTEWRALMLVIRSGHGVTQKCDIGIGLAADGRTTYINHDCYNWIVDNLARTPEFGLRLARRLSTLFKPKKGGRS